MEIVMLIHVHIHKYIINIHPYLNINFFLFKGYVRRQALFTCKTCNNNNNEQLAGFCAACAYHCHANHEVNELYTKR